MHGTSQMGRQLGYLLLGILLAAAGIFDVQSAPVADAASFGYIAGFSGASMDRGQAIAVDPAGNAYSTGNILGIVDVDPGPGVVNLGIGPNTQTGYLVKQDVSGALVWARSLAGAGSAMGLDVTLDAAGNVYVVGIFNVSLDMDPGPAVASRSSIGGSDVFVMKFTPTGEAAWGRTLGSSGNDWVSQIAVDGSGRLYVTGSFTGSASFDPGPGPSVTVHGDSVDRHNTFVAALDTSGAVIWAQSFRSWDYNQGRGVASDDDGSIYVSGTFKSPTDIDPGAGVQTVSSAGDVDIYVVKLNASGGLVWARTFGGGGADSSGRLVLDSVGNAYVLGAFEGVVDIDPGVVQIASAGQQDALVLKLSPNGALVWARTIGGPEIEFIVGIALDGADNVYLAGGFQNTVDFDPGPGVLNFTSPGSGFIIYDAFVLKLDVGGSLVWVHTFGDAGFDAARSVALDSLGNLYLTGNFQGTVDFDPGPGVRQLAGAGVEEAFVLKLAQTDAPVQTLPQSAGNR